MSGYGVTDKQKGSDESTLVGKHFGAKMHFCPKGRECPVDHDEWLHPEPPTQEERK